MSGLRCLRNIQDIQRRIGDDLAKNTSGPVSEGSPNRHCIQAGDKVRVDAQLLKIPQKSYGPAIQTAGGNDFVARSQQVQ